MLLKIVLQNNAISLLLTFFSGGVLFFGHMVEVFWPIALFSFALFLFVLVREDTVLRRISLALLFGFLYGGAACLALWHTLPFDWLRFSTVAQVFIVGLYWFFASVAFGLPYILLGCIRWEKVPTSLLLLLFPSLMLLATALSVQTFNFLVKGVDTVLVYNFSAVNPAYFFVEHSLLLSVAPYGGIYTIAFLGVMASAFLFVGIKHLFAGEKKKAFMFLGVVAVFCLSSFVSISSYYFEKGARESITVGAVSFFFTPVQRSSEKNTELLTSFFTDVLLRTKHENLDILVFPENASIYLLLQKNPALRDILRSETTVASSYVKRGEDKKMRAYGSFIEREKGLALQTQKIHLTPLGEYLPLLFEYLLSVFASDPVFVQAKYLLNTRPGQELSVYKKESGVVYAGLYCSEMLSLSLIQSAVEKGAEVLVNPVSQAWFNNSKIYERQYRRIAQVQAASVYRPVILASNMTPAYIIEPTGKIQKKSEWPTQENALHIIVGDIRPQTIHTPYILFGSVPILLFSFVIVLYWFLRSVRHTRGKLILSFSIIFRLFSKVKKVANLLKFW